MAETQAVHAYASDYSRAVIGLHGRRTVANSAAYILEHMKTHLHPSVQRSDANLRILDVGCGPGSITIDFAENYYPASDFVGLEYSSEPLDQAQAAAKEAELTNIDFQVGNAMDLSEFDDGMFDLVYCHQVLQHLSDPVQALSEMRRVCRVGGLVAAKESCHFQWYPRLPGLDKYNELFYQVNKSTGGHPNPGSYIHVWAKQAGFSRDQITCSTSSWLYTTPEERKYWGGSFAQRLDPKQGAAFTKNALSKGFATEEELEKASNDFLEWTKDEDGWYCVYHGEIVCRKTE